jgi:4-hydroxy-tetrahydrodipicolinate synthase
MIPSFTGLHVALATPFTDAGALDLPGFRRLVRHVVAGGVEALVPLGSTGEAATLTDDERDALLAACLEEAGRCPVIAGASSNDTQEAAAYARRAAQLGVQGLLVVTPYYNKPGTAGLLAHFRAVAEAAPGLPIVVYNVPGRTGLNLTPEALAQLWTLPAVAAVKESSGNLGQVVEIAAALPATKRLLAGDDNLALPSIAAGASGLVSVMANVAPQPTRAFLDAAREGRLGDAQAWQRKLLPLMQALFVESNPIPVKAALAQLGLCGDALRLPLTTATSATRERLAAALASAGLAPAKSPTSGSRGTTSQAKGRKAGAGT